MQTILSSQLNELSNDTPIFVKFYSPDCAPCKAIQPTLDELEQEFDGQIQLVQLDISDERNQDAMARFRVRSVPTFAVVEDNAAVDAMVGGNHTKQALSMFLDRNLSFAM